MNVLFREDFFVRKGISAERLLGRKPFNGPCASGVDEIDEVDMSIGDKLEIVSH